MSKLVFAHFITFHQFPVSSVRFFVCLAVIVLFSFNVYPQSNLIAVLDSNKTTILTIQNEKIVVSSGNNTIYTVKGNLIFAGDSDNKNDIVFMLNAPDVFSRKTAQLLVKKDNQPLLTATKGKIFLGAVTNRKELQLGALEKTDSSVVFLNTGKTKPVFEIKSNRISSAQMMAVVTYFMAIYEMDKALLDSLSARAQQNAMPAGTGTIRRLWSSGGNEDFVWDGRVLRNRWNYNEFEQWEFDGQTLRRAWFNTGEDFEWNGKTLQRKWLNDNALFTVDGNSIRKVFGETHDEFYIQGNIIKRAFTTIGTDEWEVNGEIPLPVIILVVFRIAR
jgi:hypothetical protein